jgi:hypothetical protein
MLSCLKCDKLQSLVKPHSSYKFVTSEIRIAAVGEELAESLKDIDVKVAVMNILFMILC